MKMILILFWLFLFLYVQGWMAIFQRATKEKRPKEAGLLTKIGWEIWIRYMSLFWLYIFIFDMYKILEEREHDR